MVAKEKTLQQAIDDPTDPAYFHQSEADYTAAALFLERTTHRQIELRDQLRQAQSKLANRATEIAINGGTSTVAIDGANAEKRKAQTELAVSTDPTAMRLTLEVRQVERSIAMSQADETVASNRMSMAKRRLDYAIAFVSHRTALLYTGAPIVPPLQFEQRPRIRLGGPIAPIRTEVVN
jgi:hypothetical protein